MLAELALLRDRFFLVRNEERNPDARRLLLGDWPLTVLPALGLSPIDQDVGNFRARKFSRGPFALI